MFSNSKNISRSIIDLLTKFRIGVFPVDGFANKALSMINFYFKFLNAVMNELPKQFAIADEKALLRIQLKRRPHFFMFK